MKNKLSNKTILLCIIFLSFIGLSWYYIEPTSSKDQSLIKYHSSELEYVEEKVDDKTIIYYKDTNNNVVKPSDIRQTYLVRESDDNAHTVQEYLLDKDKKLIQGWNGYYYVRNTYNDDNLLIRIDYLNKNHKLINTSNYATITRSYNKENKIYQEHYFDASGNKVAVGNYYAIEYNYQDDYVEITYLDQNNNPTSFNKLHRYYDDQGRTIKEFYFDEDNKPVKNYNDVYGVAYRYDELNRIDCITNLNQYGQPMTNNSGYAYIYRKFYKDNSVQQEHYYDTHNQPLDIGDGVYGKYYDGSKVYLLSKDHHKIFRLDNFLSNYPRSVIFFGIVLCFIAGKMDKKYLCLLLVGYILFMLNQTLLHRELGTKTAELELFWSYKVFFTDTALRREIIDNIWLFIPLGAMLHGYINKWWKVILIVIIGSLSIELIQYFFGLGLFEFDDIFNNALGGLLGILVYYLFSNSKTRC